jgi:hypothetical protein
MAKDGSLRIGFYLVATALLVGAPAMRLGFAEEARTLGSGTSGPGDSPPTRSYASPGGAQPDGHTELKSGNGPQKNDGGTTSRKSSPDAIGRNSKTGEGGGHPANGGTDWSGNADAHADAHAGPHTDTRLDDHAGMKDLGPIDTRMSVHQQLRRPRAKLDKAREVKINLRRPNRAYPHLQSTKATGVVGGSPRNAIGLSLPSRDAGPVEPHFGAEHPLVSGGDDRHANAGLNQARLPHPTVRVFVPTPTANRAAIGTIGGNNFARRNWGAIGGPAKMGGGINGTTLRPAH